jgi:sugar lactone lactonase YvrE
MPHDFKLIVRDIKGAEGPCVDLQGRVFMVGPNQGRIIQVNPDGSTRDLAKYDGIPAGLQLDRAGNLWCADMKRGVTKVTAEGVLTFEVTTFEDKPIRGCNDCSFDSQGNLYLTAPAGSGKGKPNGDFQMAKSDDSTPATNSATAWRSAATTPCSSSRRP